MRGSRFSILDELFFKILVNCLALKLQEIDNKLALFHSNERLNDTLTLCQTLGDSRNHENLSFSLRLGLREYMNFKDVGVLIYDEREKLLFTL